MYKEYYQYLMNLEKEYPNNYKWDMNQLLYRLEKTSFKKLIKYEHYLLVISLGGEILRKYGDVNGVSKILTKYYFDVKNYRNNNIEDTENAAEDMVNLYKELSKEKEVNK